MTTLQGRVAIVTGGGSGLGAATAAVLAREGAAVVISGRREHMLEQTAEGIRAVGGKVLPVRSDAANPADITALVDETVRQFGRVDVLVNNAGRLGQFVITHDVTLADFDDFIATNLRGPFLLMQAVIPHMLRQGGGSIINIASMGGIVGLKYCVSYAAAKGGLVQITRTAALDYGDKVIRVNCICPGGMQPTETFKIPPEEMVRSKEATAPGSPVGRAAHVSDVGELVLFLAGPHSECMTGAIIPFDGGYTAR